jgi:hypothetical protein
MKRLIHRITAIVATLCIGTFFVSSIVVELFGSPDMVATVKRLIVFPGLFILVPSIALTGATGFSLSGNRKGGLIDIKKRWMPFIAMNGLLVLVPAAIFLNYSASQYSFTWSFYLVQGLELIAGAINLTLMSLNMRDGLKITGKWRRPKKQSA